MSNRISREVGDAFAKSESRKRQVAIAWEQLAAKSAIDGTREGSDARTAAKAFPLKLSNSVRLLGEAGVALVEAIGGYDLAQFELFVAVGQTPRHHACRIRTNRFRPMHLRMTPAARLMSVSLGCGCSTT